MEVEPFIEICNWFAGYVSLHLWISTDVANDADIFVLLQKLDSDDNPVSGGYGYIGPDGRLRVSHRKRDTSRSTSWFPYHPHDEEELLTPGHPVSVDIEIRPMGMRWHKGEKLQLTIAGYNVLSKFRQGPPGGMNLPGPATRNEGNHIIHAGGAFDSYLLMPKVE